MTITLRQSIVKHAARALCLVTVVASGVAAQTQPKPQTQPPLKSPWDGQHISSSDIPYMCPEVPNLPHDFTTTRYYSDPKSSIVDPLLKKIYDDSVAPDYPSGLRLLLAGIEMLRLRRPDDSQESLDDDDPDAENK